MNNDKRLLKAIEATKELPGEWTVEISLDSTVQKAFLVDPDGELVECDEMYDDFASLPEQIECCIAHAKACNDNFPQLFEEDDEDKEDDEVVF